MMNKTYSALLALLLVWSTAAQLPFPGRLTFSLADNALSAQGFTCLHNEGYHNVNLRVYKMSNPAGLDVNGIKGLNNVATTALGYGAYMEVCRGIDAATQVNDVFNAISSVLYGNLLVKIVEFNSKTDDSRCSWTGYTQAENCAFIIGLLADVGNTGYFNPYVHSTTHIWNTYFGSNCNAAAVSNARNTYLSYESYLPNGEVNAV
jgi:hypothetical protein